MRHFPQRASDRLELRQPSKIGEAAQILTKMEDQTNQRKPRNGQPAGNPPGNWRGRKLDAVGSNFPEKNEQRQPEDDGKRRNPNLDRWGPSSQDLRGPTNLDRRMHLVQVRSSELNPDSPLSKAKEVETMTKWWYLPTRP